MHRDNDRRGAPTADRRRPAEPAPVASRAEGWSSAAASLRVQRGRSSRIRCRNAQGGGDVSGLVSQRIERAAQHVLSVRSRDVDGAAGGQKIVPGQVERARAAERPVVRDRDRLVDVRRSVCRRPLA